MPLSKGGCPAHLEGGAASDVAKRLLGGLLLSEGSEGAEQCWEGRGLGTAKLRREVDWEIPRDGMPLWTMERERTGASMEAG